MLIYHGFTTGQRVQAKSNARVRLEVRDPQDQTWWDEETATKPDPVPVVPAGAPETTQVVLSISAALIEPTPDE